MGSQKLVLESRREWATACDVQQRFMRNVGSPTGALDYSAKCRQVHEIGGDCYDFAPLPDGSLALAVGDASGKGLAAALMISNVQSSLRTAALFSGNDGAAMLRAVNRHVYATSLMDRYATLFYAVVDRAARKMRYVNAGHPPPIVLRADGSMDWLETGGAPVGMFPEWPYEEGLIELNPGDIVVGCTDGVSEAENPFGKLWGMEGLRRAAAENRARDAHELVDAIFKSMDQFSCGHQTDDATVAVLRIV
jgi:sigma-B regulation protein RsbU (phosphoserine phosphatase)